MSQASQICDHEVLQVVYMCLQKLNTEQSWNDDGVVNMELGWTVGFSGTRECN